MRYVAWTNKARRDLRGIHAYVAADSAQAAQQLANRIVAAAESLIDFPYKGRSIRRGMRQLSTVYPYIVRYTVDGDRIEIARVYHGAQRVRSKRLGWVSAPPEAAAIYPLA
jgi:plasmid stabilization system protein ParE